ncbi:anthranilate synthase component I family protein [Congregibacter litoralis]|nr:anthranilate synthase component I family protein [Congregibacter litoralis]
MSIESMAPETAGRRERSIPVPYFADPCSLYDRIRSLGQAVLLDSGDDASRGRFDIVAAQPDASRGLRLEAGCSGEALHEALSGWQRMAEEQAPSSPLRDLPFTGGYIGHFSYELGRRLLKLPATSPGALPIAVVHYYPWAVVQDRLEQKSWLVGEPDAVDGITDTVQNLLGNGEASESPPGFRLEEPFRHPWSLEAYRQCFEKVKHYIASGDCYQINIGQPFSAAFTGDLFQAYRQLRAIAKAPFSGFFPLARDHALLCLSPERFLTADQGRVETRPIKGTRPRHENAETDQAQAQALMGSPKERAENLMIVDLLRNDIGRYCRPGTVRADELFSLESYSTVHHLVSVVTGELAPGRSALDLLLGCMPGGSITGAPKRRAMEIINELEPAPRQSWCGALFYLSRHGRLDSNITIRTLYNTGDMLHCWAGGGLVDDSRLEAEYQEQRDKVGAFLTALEKTLSSDGHP